MSTQPTKLSNDDVIVFGDSFRKLQGFVHATAIDKGWWEGKRNDGEMIALIHTELSEALENIRNGCPSDDKIPRYLGVEAELADVIIRIMDIAEGRNWNVAGALTEKVVYNTTRPHKHGKEF